MAANLFVRELPATYLRRAPVHSGYILSSRGERDGNLPSRQILFLLFAPKGLLFFYLARCQGDIPSQLKHY
eukprot:scaffold6008_cov118-Isochrysis_galbana.AAC.7